MPPPDSPPSCRSGCGACCTAPSISSPIPGMPAGVPCVQLDAALRCRIFGQPERPPVCAGLQPSHEMCGRDAVSAMVWLTRLEAATAPSSAR